MYGGSDPAGHLPPSTKLVELRSPDRTPSFSLFEHVTRGKDVLAIMEIKAEDGSRLGALVIAARGDEATGRLTAHGVSSFTWDDIQHGD